MSDKSITFPIEDYKLQQIKQEYISGKGILSALCAEHEAHYPSVLDIAKRENWELDKYKNLELSLKDKIENIDINRSLSKFRKLAAERLLKKMQTTMRAIEETTDLSLDEQMRLEKLYLLLCKQAEALGMKIEQYNLQEINNTQINNPNINILDRIPSVNV